MMASFEDSLYDDLFEHLGDGKTVVKTSLLEVEEELHRVKADLELSTTKIAQLQDQNSKLQKEKEILVKNISCLFKTAQLEIARKDKHIKELNAENMRMKLRGSGAGNGQHSRIMEKGPSMSPCIVATGTPFKGSQEVPRQDNICESNEEEGHTASPCLVSKCMPNIDSQAVSRQENLREHSEEQFHQRHWNSNNEWKNRQPLRDLSSADEFSRDRLEALVLDGNGKRQRADYSTDAFKERRRRLMLSSKPGGVTCHRYLNDVDEEGGRGVEEDRQLRWYGKDCSSLGNSIDRVAEEEQRQRRKCAEDKQTAKQGRDYAYVLDSTNSRGEEQGQIRKDEEDRHAHLANRAGEESRHIRKAEEDRQLPRHRRDYPSMENPSCRVEEEPKHARKGDENRRSRYTLDNERRRIERPSSQRRGLSATVK